ncbi:MAG: replicative DNA helicase [Pseudomonadales bacterium]
MTTASDTASLSLVSNSADARLRVPPHSLEAEQAVLGGLLLDHQTFDQVSEILHARDFYAPENRLIFSAMAKLSERAKPLDIITVSELLDQDGELNTVGGIAHLAELAQHTPGTANLIAYAQIVRERATLRQLIRATHNIADHVYAPDGRDSTELLASAEKIIADIAEGRPSESGFEGISPLLKNTLDRITYLSELNSDITGLDTGFFELNKMTGGLQPSELVILAARPSMGKTAFAMNLVEHIALNQQKPVLVFSLEMPAESVTLRLLSSVGRIDQTRIRSGKLEHDEWDKLGMAMAKLKDSPLFIDDTTGLSPADMRARARRMQREHGDIALIVVDYLQLMHIPGAKDGRTAEVSEISRSLKSIAREFKCPVIALSQLNRSVDSRTDKRPNNSDLRESGAIEQDADLIIFLYRDEYYNEDSPDKGIAEFIIGKQRNGPIGKRKMSFQGQYTRFDNLAHGYEEKTAR